MNEDLLRELAESARRLRAERDREAGREFHDYLDRVAENRRRREYEESLRRTEFDNRPVPVVPLGRIRDGELRRQLASDRERWNARAEEERERRREWEERELNRLDEERRTAARKMLEDQQLRDMAAAGRHDAAEVARRACEQVLSTDWLRHIEANRRAEEENAARRERDSRAAAEQAKRLEIERTRNELRIRQEAIERERQNERRVREEAQRRQKEHDEVMRRLQEELLRRRNEERMLHRPW